MAHPVRRRNRGPLAALGLAALLAVAPPLTQVPPPAGEPCSAAAPRGISSAQFIRYSRKYRLSFSE